MEPLAVVRTLKRRWRIIFAVTVLGGLLGYGTTLLASDEQEQSYFLAIHVLATDPGSGGGNANQGGGVNLNRTAVLATTGEVPERVATEVGLEPPAVVESVSVDPRPENGFLEIAAVADNPNQAILIADTMANELVLFLQEQAQEDLAAEEARLEAELVEIETQVSSLAAECDARPTGEQTLCRSDLSALQAQYEATQQELTTERNQAENAANLSTLQTASAQRISEGQYEAALRTNAQGALGQPTNQGTGANSNQPVAQQRVDAAGSDEPDPVVRTGLGALIGFVLAVGGVFVFDRLDPRLHDKEQAEAAFGFPVLAEIPPLSRQQQRERHVLAHEAPRSRAAEAYRTVRSALLFLDHTEANGSAGSNGSNGADAGHGKVVLVTSAGPSEGKTTSVANLATVLAETGASVLVINCDFRRPTLHEYLGGELVPRKVVDTRIPGVRVVHNVVLDARGANPAAVLAEQRKLATAARKHFDIVLLDTAPVLSTNDAIDVLPVADQVVVVARAGRTTSEAADRAAEKLERLDAPVAGVILVASTSSAGSRYYYYYEPEGDQVVPERVGTQPLEGAATRDT